MPQESQLNKVRQPGQPGLSDSRLQGPRSDLRAASQVSNPLDKLRRLNEDLSGDIDAFYRGYRNKEGAPASWSQEQLVQLSHLYHSLQARIEVTTKMSGRLDPEGIKIAKALLMEASELEKISHTPGKELNARLDKFLGEYCGKSKAPLRKNSSLSATETLDYAEGMAAKTVENYGSELKLLKQMDERFRNRKDFDKEDRESVEAQLLINQKQILRCEKALLSP